MAPLQGTLGPVRQVAPEGRLQEGEQEERADREPSKPDRDAGRVELSPDAAHPSLADPLLLLQLR